MGCVNVKHAGVHEQVLDILTERDKNVDEKLSPFLNFSHPSNVNNKYNFIVQIDRERKTGKGIFETQAYVFKGNEQ